jgi:prefoldin alpha subunit
MLAGQEILVPLTQSLYVSGTVASTEHVLIDVGTNYYVEVCDVQLTAQLV